MLLPSEAGIEVAAETKWESEVNSAVAVIMASLLAPAPDGNSPSVVKNVFFAPGQILMV